MRAAALLELTVGEVAARHPGITQVLSVADPTGPKPDSPLGAWLASLDADRLAEAGLDADLVLARIEALAIQAEAWQAGREAPLGALRILGGRDKDGRAEALDLTLIPGDVLCIVGPTGSGKSRLLADIECLAQGDTPSGRRVLVDGTAPDGGWRYGSNRRLIAQLSQNMNFVVDLTVAEFLAMHAECRLVAEPVQVADEVIACANRLAGERFGPDTSLTQLSGGQSRALMIADTALLSASPVVLIDEIENAGIDRQKSLELLIAREKIVLVSTHDPILALMGGRRIAIRNGAVASIIETGEAERANLRALEEIDRRMMDLRRRLRAGECIDEPLEPWTWMP
jgi:ABC-type lipoprotein export system ATPase subunit